MAAGLVPTELIPTVVSSLIDELTNPAGVAKAHIDTGLTATYFMGKIMAGGMEGVVGADAGASNSSPTFLESRSCNHVLLNDAASTKLLLTAGFSGSLALQTALI